MCGNYMISPFENVNMGGKYGDVKYKKFRVDDDQQEDMGGRVFLGVLSLG